MFGPDHTMIRFTVILQKKSARFIWIAILRLSSRRTSRLRTGKGDPMGKVITNKIVVISKNESICITRDEPLMLTADGPVHIPEPMHLSEEMVFVFDENGNVVGKMDHHKMDELQ